MCQDQDTNLEKQKILDCRIYSNIVNIINRFDGLSIDCGLNLIILFPQVNPHTLDSILFSEWNKQTKARYGFFLRSVIRWIDKFESENTETCYNPNALLNIAKETRVPPALLCKIVINKKYENTEGFELLDFLRQPNLIPEEHYSANIRICTLSDNQFGSTVDIQRRFLGEEYEQKLKILASQNGLIFYDEAKLRKTGFDKTPDLKLVLPCFYKGRAVNWIESKALFGDLSSHLRYLNDQLQSYNNRFGPGIVIYWFGFLELITEIKENGEGLIILDDFPQTKYLQNYTI